MPALLEVDHLKIDARKDDGSLLPIVKGVSFNVARGELVALLLVQRFGCVDLTEDLRCDEGCGLGRLGVARPAVPLASEESPGSSLPGAKSAWTVGMSSPCRQRKNDSCAVSAWPICP